MFYQHTPSSRFLLGTAGYPSPAILQQAIETSGAEIITVSLRREGSAGDAFRELLQQLNTRILPNTAGCHTVKEAVTTAQMARELFGTPWIKLEVIGHADTLQPDPFALVEAARILCADGFQVFPYTTEDLIVGEKLLEAGCEVLMPWGAPIGSGQGLRNIEGLRSMRAWFKDVPLIIDAGIGAPSQAAQAMEMGFDGILLNTAVAKARDPVRMAAAFSAAIDAGQQAFQAGLMEQRDMAAASTPIFGLAQFS
ncbi:thiazole synthase [Pantoea brenneri]|uniref:thiazole synthase n=1 Tax=Pantoea brenneri TaxID=472694 RepID=UPI00289E7A4F|nr:thiazole synthase [Pantoea brenneri]